MVTVAEAEERERAGILLPISGNPESDHSRQLHRIDRARRTDTELTSRSTSSVRGRAQRVIDGFHGGRVVILAVFPVDVPNGQRNSPSPYWAGTGGAIITSIVNSLIKWISGSSGRERTRNADMQVQRNEASKDAERERSRAERADRNQRRALAYAARCQRLLTQTECVNDTDIPLWPNIEKSTTRSHLIRCFFYARKGQSHDSQSSLRIWMAIRKQHGRDRCRCLLHQSHRLDVVRESFL